MLSRKNLLSVSMAGALALGVWAVASAQGELPDQRTFFTFSAPVTLPGTTLQAGKYEFKLMNSASDRHIVQIFDSDGKIVTTLFAIPSIRMDPPDNPEIRFMETPAEMPPAVQTWWYPGNRTGHEFLYSKQQATMLAKVNQRGVLAGGEQGDVTRINAAGEETKVSSADAKPEEVYGRAQAGEIAARNAAAAAAGRPAPPPPTPPIPDTPAPPVQETPRQPAPVATPEPVTPAAPQPAPVSRTDAADMDRTSLPHSASPLPMFMLIGVASLGAGLVLRRRLA
jgi:hypothetical protein